MGEVKGRIMSEALELVERMVQALNNHLIEGQVRRCNRMQARRGQDRGVSQVPGLSPNRNLGFQKGQPNRADSCTP